MRVLALNIQHAAANCVPPLAQAVLGAAPDIVLLSEFYLDAQGRQLLDLLAEGGLLQNAQGVPASRSHPYTVTIASRLPLIGVRVPLGGSPNAHRVLEARIAGITVVAVYFPLKQHHDPFWEDEFLPYVETLRAAPAIVAGDWNTGSRALDISGGPVAGMARFDALIASGWTDAWRSLHPEERDYSWYSGAGNGFRLDHAVLTPSLASRLRRVDYLHGVRVSGLSDHSALVVELDDPDVATEQEPLVRSQDRT